MYSVHLKTNETCAWFDNVKYVFDECGLSFIWQSHSCYGS